jgi:hypothetical protein
MTRFSFDFDPDIRLSERSKQTETEPAHLKLGRPSNDHIQRRLLLEYPVTEVIQALEES